MTTDQDFLRSCGVEPLECRYVEKVPRPLAERIGIIIVLALVCLNLYLMVRWIGQ
jgi:hypothetical protein